MDITELRSEIDKIDDELLKLFCARMEISAQVADYKRERNLPIFVPARERAKIPAPLPQLARCLAQASLPRCPTVRLQPANRRSAICLC